MSGPKHSPEPWEVDGGAVRAADEGYVWQSHRYDTPQTPADKARAVACVNFLAGVPSEALSLDAPPSDARGLALAVLRGDELAAYGLADELLERRKQPEGFVSRAELVEVLRTAVDWPSLPLSGEPCPGFDSVLKRLGLVAPALSAVSFVHDGIRAADIADNGLARTIATTSAPPGPTWTGGLAMPAEGDQ